MKEYKIKFSPVSRQDMRDIVRYIKNKLKEPSIARKYKNLFKEEIVKLTDFPERFVSIDEEKNAYRGIRKLIVKNYIVFYRINVEKMLVTIERVLYGASNWEEKLWLINMDKVNIK